MKKKLLTFLISLFLIQITFAIDIYYSGFDKITLHDHQVYKLFWDPSTKNPAVVWWTLTNEDAIESDEIDNRTNDFRPCSLGSSKKESYVKSGYDKGHMCPNNDRDYSKEDSSLTFLMCNMCPQTSKLNRGSWKKLESETHKIAKTYGKIEIVCGPIYDKNIPPKYLKDSVRIPNKFFKILHYDNKTIVYIFDQDGNKKQSNLNEIKELTALDIKF